MQPLPWRPWGAIAVLALVGCAPADAPPAAVHAAVAVEGEAASIVPDLMALLVEPAAGVVLAAAESPMGSEHAPVTAEAWQAVVDAAAQLAQGSELLARPALSGGRGDWVRFTAAMRDGAAAVAVAGRQRDGATLALAGARVRGSCQSCHARYGAPREPWR